MVRKSNFIIVILLAMVAFFIIFNCEFKVEEKNSNIEKKESNYKEIEIARPIALSGKSKKFVYEIRKSAVKKSIFKKENYEPSEIVFGQINDFKPWIEYNTCINPKGKAYINGVAEESRFINNPSALVMIEYPYLLTTSGYEQGYCTSDMSMLLPQKLEYDEINKEIKLTYLSLPFITGNDSSNYSINGLNARDLGYKYVYIDLEKSTFKPRFEALNNLTNEVFEFSNFIHLGGSCGAKGGCNNGSPRQPWGEFNYDKYLDKKNAEIYIKLWKTKPKSKNNTPDMVERIVFEYI